MNANLEHIGAFIRLGRPLFLGGGFLLYALGAALAVRAGAALDVGLYLIGQLAVTSFQLMTHYCNDYFDYEADLANSTPTKWSGGSRVLPGNELPRRVALIAALVLGAVGATAAGLAAATDGAGPLVVPLYAVMMVLAWEYSAPPLRLHSTGWGELDTAIVVTVLVPLAGFYLQAPEMAGIGTVLLAIAPLALLQIAMLLAIEFPDHDGDAATGKRTLVVRVGPARGAHLYAAVTLAAYLIVPLLAIAGLPAPIVIAALIPAPVAAWRAWRAVAGDCADRNRWERVTFFSVALLVATTAAELIAAVLFL